MTDGIAAHVRAMFELSERQRLGTEQQWLRDLRQAKGIYPDGTQFRENGSEVFINFTAPKIRAVNAKLKNTLFPSGSDGKCWEILPTPAPFMSNIGLNAGDRIPYGYEMDPEAIMAQAKTKADAMSRVIDDQLEEAGFRNKVEAAIKSGVLFGTGVIKGPATELSTQTRDYAPTYSEISLWRFYPDMSVSDLADCRYVIERHCMTKAELLKLGRRQDFDGAAIGQYLTERPEGDYLKKLHELDILLMSDDTTNTMYQAKDLTGRYEVLEYWGWISQEEALDRGVIEGIDAGSATGDVLVNVFVLGDRQIKITKSFIDDKPPYHVFYYEKDSTSIFGAGLPRIMADVQSVINAATRAMIDNAASVAGPQMLIRLGLLAHNSDVETVYPGKRWFQKDTGFDNSPNAISAVNFDSHIQDYLALLAKFEDMSDKISSLPSSLFGDIAPSQNETAHAVSIRQSNLNVVLDLIMRSIDSMIESIITTAYDWNMRFNPRPDIKGDMKIIAKGSTSLMSKEVRTQTLDMFATALKPDERAMLNVYEFLKERMRAHDLDPARLLKSPEQMSADAAAASAQTQGIASTGQTMDINGAVMPDTANTAGGLPPAGGGMGNINPQIMMR
jgi:hypothetical protein